MKFKPKPKQCDVCGEDYFIRMQKNIRDQTCGHDENFYFPTKKESKEDFPEENVKINLPKPNGQAKSARKHGVL